MTGKVWIVQGVSAMTPGCPLSVHASEASAVAEAVTLVNILLREGRMRRTATAENWADRLLALQGKQERAGLEGQCDVWIRQETVHDIPTPAPKFAYDAEHCPSQHWNRGDDICADCGSFLG
jgi:hypothetical protein